MKKIKNVTDELEIEARKNAEGFDHSELCYQSIFYLLDDNGVFYNAVNDIMRSKQPDNIEIELKDIRYGVVKEIDDKFYPSVELLIRVTGEEIVDFVFMVTPFNATMETVEMWDNWNGDCDKELTKIWQIIMKGIFKEKWSDAHELFCAVADMKRMLKFRSENKNRSSEIDETYECGTESI